MADKPIEDRRFTDQEVREILKKAVQQPASRAIVKSEGLSLEELKAIGGEVGIDPDRLEDAARSVALGGEGKTNSLLGAPTLLNIERRVEGELDPKDTPEILSLIRRIMGTQGDVDEIHGSLEWKTKGDSGERYITVFSREGNTTIRASANMTNAAVVTYLPAGILAVLGTVIATVTAAETGNPVGFLFAVGILPIVIAALRTVLRKVSDSTARKLQEATNEVARLVERSSADRPNELGDQSHGSPTEEE